MLRIWPVLIPLLALVACGSSNDSTDATSSSGGGAGGGGGSANGGGPFRVATHTPQPVVKKHGSGAYANPELVTITFPDYDQTDNVQKFGDWLASSSYIQETIGEYGVKSAKHLAKIELTDAPPLYDNCALEKHLDHHVKTCGNEALETLIKARVADQTLPSPTEHPEVVYMVYFPKGSQFNGGGVICEQYDGYHTNMNVDGVTIVYAVVGECDGLTNTVSHEFTEAASDPEPYGPNGGNGYYIDSELSDPWDWVTDDEIADMCEYFPSVTQDGWPVARIWSNKAATASQDPCLPVPPGDPPFRDVSAAPATLQKVARGKSATFELTGWSTAPAGAWPIFTSPSMYGNEKGQSFDPTAKLSADTITNGGKVELTLTVPPKTPVGSYGIVGVYNDQHYAQVWYVGVIAE